MQINKINIILKVIIIFVFVITYSFSIKAQTDTITNSKERTKELLQNLKTQALQTEIDITVKSVEITKFPKIKLIIEAYNKLGQPLDTLLPDQITIYENESQFTPDKIVKIPVANKLPWDFIFVVDITGSMQPQIDGVVNNLLDFANNLEKRGIDYKLGLLLFSDNIDRVYQPTNSADVFLSWLSNVRAFGGGDEKENALEALVAIPKRITFRPEANKVAILITDAPYHQRGERGDGTTLETTASTIDSMNKNDIRVFTIAPPKLKDYQYISDQTRGTNYNIAYSFTSVLENFTRQITNLFLVTYTSSRDVIPDSIEIGLFDQEHSKIVKKTIPIFELGRKLIIENLLFQTGKYELPNDVSELNILAKFMQSKPAMTVTIEGHTDWVGSNELNDVLSERRAESVKNYLVNKGIDTKRIQTHGFGKRKPIASNETEFGRSLNRRTEIVITSK
jgi:outer membrane protein OmpA-like peptidoglycan-associated protein